MVVYLFENNFSSVLSYKFIRQYSTKKASIDQWRHQDFVSGSQVWRREKTENTKCMSCHPKQHCILLSMHYCIRPVCHSHTTIQEAQLMLSTRSTRLAVSRGRAEKVTAHLPTYGT